MYSYLRNDLYTSVTLIINIQLKRLQNSRENSLMNFTAFRWFVLKRWGLFMKLVTTNFDKWRESKVSTIKYNKTCNACNVFLASIIEFPGMVSSVNVFSILNQK